MCAIWRPGRVFIVPIAIGELFRLTARDINQEQVLASLVDKASAIEPVEQPVNHTHPGQGLTVLGLFVERTNHCAKDDSLAVR